MISQFDAPATVDLLVVVIEQSLRAKGWRDHRIIDLAHRIPHQYGFGCEVAANPLKLGLVCQAREFWHRDQKGEILADGNYLLEVPYFDDRELINDILRHGSQVEVLAPEELKTRLKQEVHLVLAKLQ